MTSLLSCRPPRRPTGSVAVLPCQGHRSPTKRLLPPIHLSPLLHCRATAHRCTRSRHRRRCRHRRHHSVFVQTYTRTRYTRLFTYTRRSERQRRVPLRYVLRVRAHMCGLGSPTRTVKGASATHNGLRVDGDDDDNDMDAEKNGKSMADGGSNKIMREKKYELCYYMFIRVYRDSFILFFLFFFSIRATKNLYVRRGLRHKHA